MVTEVPARTQGTFAAEVSRASERRRLSAPPYWGAARVRGAYQRWAATHLGRRVLRMRNTEPLISFTFDDFPRSAATNGARILASGGLAGTFYVALSLADHVTATGQMFSIPDLAKLVDHGHELGCHTFDHLDAAVAAPSAFERSIKANARALRELGLGAQFESHSYPIGNPRLATKRRAGKHFRACRGGGQKMNRGVVDLNYLNAYFLEQSGGMLDIIRRQIEQTVRSRGWLIFATHDVAEGATRYGCNPRFFADVVQCAVKSGASVVKVSEALTRIGVQLS